MNMIRVVLRAVLLAVSLMVSQMAAGMLIPIKTAAAPHMAWWFASNAATGLALSLIAVRSPWRRWKLALLSSAIPLAIGAVNLIEGFVFLTNAGLDVRRVMLMSLLSGAVTVPLFFLVFLGLPAPDRSSDPPMKFTPAGKLWRFVVSDVAYVFLYFVAGMIIFPFVAKFYATQVMPSFGRIIALQELIRGPVFVLICLLMRHMLGLSRIGGAVATGLLFALLTGIAPLIGPNPYIPDAVRWVHLCEVTSSNFVFGMVVAWLWSRSAPALKAAAQAA